jgi:hypothetical protein
MQFQISVLLCCGIIMATHIPIWGQPVRPEPPAQTDRTELVFTDGQAKFSRIFTHAQNPMRDHALDDEIGPATTNSTVFTNMDGLWFVLATATNTYNLGEPIECRGMLKNSTTNGFDLPQTTWAGGYAPPFGRLLVTNQINVGLKQAKVRGPSIKTRASGPVFDQVRQGVGGPRWCFRLTDYFDLTVPGTYKVSFAGKLPSVTEPGKVVEFETPPLVLKITSPDSKGATSSPNR